MCLCVCVYKLGLIIFGMGPLPLPTFTLHESYDTYKIIPSVSPCNLKWLFTVQVN